MSSNIDLLKSKAESRLISQKSSEFFVVPKHPKDVKRHKTKYWRLSFQIQERHFIHNLYNLKPALKLLKNLRDVQLHSIISSYFLKTIVLWEVSTYDESFWTNSLSYVFMHLLKKYGECLKNEEIQYFWHPEFNLLDTVDGDLKNLSNRIESIIKDIDRNITEKPYTVLKYILTHAERTELYPSLFPPPATTVIYHYTSFKSERNIREELSSPPRCSIL